jgi:hypothetical protein
MYVIYIHTYTPIHVYISYRTYNVCMYHVLNRFLFVNLKIIKWICHANPKSLYRREVRYTV